MVIVTFKTITQLSFTLELEPSLSIGEVKQKIFADKGSDYAVELQKLIYNGKILGDDSTIEQAGIDASKFVVVMLSRKPAAATSATTESQSSTASSTNTTAPAPAPAPAVAPKLETTPAPEQLSTNSAAAVQPAAAPAAARPQSDDEPITADQENMIQNIVSMGYPRDQTIAVLRAALWNPDRAVDLLLTGDPEGEALGFAEEEAHEVASGMETLAHLPQFEEFRMAVRENPAILPNLMRQIAQVNPDLMNAISQDQEGFLRLLGAGGAGQERPAGGQQHAIRLTEEEHAAVMRIKDMGFNVPEHIILEAYLACDKNEELAVDYILNRMTEGDI